MLSYHFVLLFFFAAGYLLLIFEHQLKINKAAIAILTGTLLWVIYLRVDPLTSSGKLGELLHHLANISQVLLFLIGAMTIVELIVTHKGFDVVKRSMMIPSPRKLFWVVATLGFCMSSVLDNLATFLVLVSLVRQTVDDVKLRQLICAGLVFIVNVGGAWTPIGDITTTMLWIEGRVNTIPLITSVGLPSILSFVVFTAIFAKMLPKQDVLLIAKEDEEIPEGSKLVFYLGIAGFLAVPVMKLLWDIPPFMGIMISLGVMWVVTDRIHREIAERKVFKVEHILTKIDISCVLFFFGILLAVACLEASGMLTYIATEAQQSLSNPYFFSLAIGFLSAIVDNVPLVAGIINMYDVSVYPPDHIFWQLNAYCAGVGGSLLVIGSAPGVALMSLTNVPFGWYLRKVSWIALIGYLVGWAGIYLIN